MCGSCNSGRRSSALNSAGNTGRNSGGGNSGEGGRMADNPGMQIPQTDGANDTNPTGVTRDQRETRRRPFATTE